MYSWSPLNVSFTGEPVNVTIQEPWDGRCVSASAEKENQCNHCREKQRRDVSKDTASVELTTNVTLMTCKPSRRTVNPFRLTLCHRSIKLRTSVTGATPSRLCTTLTSVCFLACRFPDTPHWSRSLRILFFLPFFLGRK